MPASSRAYPPGAPLNVVIKSEAPADEPPVRLIFFLPNSANEAGRVYPWQAVSVQGGQSVTLVMFPQFEVYATCEMFAPDSPEDAVGRFRSRALSVDRAEALVEISPVLGSGGDVIGLGLRLDQGRSDKLEVHAAATLDRPVTVHVLQKNGLQGDRDLFEASLLSPGADHEFDTSAGFLFGFHVALFKPDDINSPLPLSPVDSAFLQSEALGEQAENLPAGTYLNSLSIDIKGSTDQGHTLEVGRVLAKRPT